MRIRQIFKFFFLFAAGMVFLGTGSGNHQIGEGGDSRFFPVPGSVGFASEPRLSTIVAFGNSLTAGLGVPRTRSYPAILEKKLQRNGYFYNVINAGVSGDTTAGGLRRVDWVLKNKPEIIILELGVNDGLRGQSLDQIYKNLETIIERIQRKGVKIILAGMKLPRNYGKDYTEGFEEIYRRLSEKYQLPLVPFLLEGVALHPELNQSDGIHPTEDGYEIVVENLWRVLIPLLSGN